MQDGMTLCWLTGEGYWTIGDFQSGDMLKHRQENNTADKGRDLFLLSTP